jgi:hypothetical protein
MQITFKRFESELARQGKSATTRRGLSWSNNASVLQSAVIVSQNGIVAHSFQADEVFTPYGESRRWLEHRLISIGVDLNVHSTSRRSSASPFRLHSVWFHKVDDKVIGRVFALPDSLACSAQHGQH